MSNLIGPNAYFLAQPRTTAHDKASQCSRFSIRWSLFAANELTPRFLDGMRAPLIVPADFVAHIIARPAPGESLHRRPGWSKAATKVL